MAENSTVAQLPSPDLSKLTVSQLKALCKERKITGYSKLGKHALIEKLTPAESLGNCNERAIVDPPLAIGVAGGTSGRSADGTALGGLAATQTQSYDVLPNPKDLTRKAPSKTDKKAKPRPPKTKKAALPALAADSVPLAEVSGDQISSTLTGHVDDVLQETFVDYMRRQSDITTSSGKQLSGDCMRSQVVTITDTVPNASATKNPPGIAELNTASPNIQTAVNSVNTALTNAVGAKRPSEDTVATSKKRKIQKTYSTAKPLAPSKSSAYKRISNTQAHSIAPPESTMISSPQVPKTQTLATDQRRPTDVIISGRRFKKLLVTKPPKAGPAHLSGASTVPSVTGASPNVSNVAAQRQEDQQVLVMYHLEFPLAPPPPGLIPITLPPSLSQRKRVNSWAIILSGISDEERARCVLVSRMFRYAVYLSASQNLTRNYSGKRLTEDVLQRYPQAMTNMWPYLRFRQQEVALRRQAYGSSFLAKFLNSKRLPTPIAERLWTSPSNERQIVIVLRFVMSRLWSALSIGTGQGDSEVAPWLNEIIVDAQEVIKGEIWSITVATQPSSLPRIQSRNTETFYVLEATCEVVGCPPTPVAQFAIGDDEHSSSVPVRADWSAYISQHQHPSNDPSSRPHLLHSLKWTNHEEYERGISRLWLKRIAGEGPLGITKHVVAERYILACIVANSVSGEWKTAAQMAQDFAGLPARMNLADGRSKSPSVNLYLPEHHHIESVHFTTSKGKTLHTALAIVQTPHREYYILRDNGMQVGCEEDGVAEVWQDVLDCNALGCEK